MNRKERRAALRRGKGAAIPAPAGDRPNPLDIAELMAEARRHYGRRQFVQAHDICHQILAREPSHVDSLNLLGLIAQTSGRHYVAVKMFSKAIASDELNAACHYNIASSYQALDRPDDAVAHFTKAIALGMSEKDVEAFIMQSPVITACLDRLAAKWPLPIKNVELLGSVDMAAVANDVFLRCAMESTTIRGVALELFLTHVRFALLQLTMASAPDFREADANVTGFFCALAQQCFINEYVFVQSEEETVQAKQLRDLLNQRLAAGSEIPPLLLVAVAAYFPLHSLPLAETLIDGDWPGMLAGLLRQQISEPLEEAQERKLLPALTAVEDSVSLQVMQQYEENPYPRWTNNPLAVLAGERNMRIENAASGGQCAKMEILIAGCGTGRHALQTAQLYPEAHVLAVDISLTSLAYARRKTREAGLHNVEYAQADILKLESIGRTFDRIEAIGVLHHLADPKVGWRVLLSLLRPKGEMHVGLYSETARRPIVDARVLIAERGYRATAENIRVCRQEIIRKSDDWRWKKLVHSTDFYSMSGCRDLLFNVMEHRFTIPEIIVFLNDHGLSFLGFDLDPGVLEKFKQQFPDTCARTDLNHWQVFEAANPETFWAMYSFLVRKN